MTKVFISVADVNHKDYKWIDTRFSLADEHAGFNKYEESHVINAAYWDLNKDLSDVTKNAGRHPLPKKEDLVELFQSTGLSLDDAIILYDDGGSPFATRAWWILQYAGFTQSYIALEGFEAIKTSGIPVDQLKPELKPTTVSPNWNEAIYTSRQEVERIVESDEEALLLDARAAERYRGEVEPLDKIAGHIPGAVNFDWEQLKENGQFYLDETVKSKLDEVVKATGKVTVYCGSGVTATPVYAALKHYGYEDVRLYVGSYSDWISKEGAQIETS